MSPCGIKSKIILSVYRSPRPSSLSPARAVMITTYRTSKFGLALTRTNSHSLSARCPCRTVCRSALYLQALFRASSDSPWTTSGSKRAASKFHRLFYFIFIQNILFILFLTFSFLSLSFLSFQFYCLSFLSLLHAQ